MKALAILICLTTAMSAFSSTKIKKIDLEEIFVVPTGYDTNDNIEFTILAKLPSACFSPSETKLTKINSKRYKVDFYIKQKQTSGCVNQNLAADLVPIYYTQTVSLGELAAGDYKIDFKQGHKLQSKAFNIAQTMTNQTDDLLYAPVTNAFIPDLIFTTKDAQLILSGIIHSSCMEVFDEDIKVTKIGNVFVIIPEAKSISDSSCREIERPLQKIISLGEIADPGAYLIHVRSQSGLSVNKVFQVREKEFDPTGR